MNYMQLEGQHFAQYRLLELLRVGSLTETYKAIQRSLERDVMVKVLKSQYQSHLDHHQAFVLGARIHAELEHPHIVPIHDYGEHDGISYAVYRLMRHDVLREQVQAGPLPLPNVAQMMKQIASALEYVHQREIAHGDPSISNIVFDESGNAYVANFHMAGFQQGQAMFAGTPDFTAPERWMHHVATPMTDQYALACITYYLITAYTPFYQAKNLGAHMQAHLNETPPVPQTLNPEIPLTVNEVLFRALAKNPADRYPTVMDFAREFEKAIQDVPKHLFISYSRRDKDYAQGVAEHLSHNGFEVWIDSEIDYGDAWFDRINDAVKTCAAFVLLMSPDAENSEWVKKEILLAKRYKKPIFPLLLDGDEFPIVIDIQFADVRDKSMPDTDFHRRLRRTVFGDV